MSHIWSVLISCEWITGGSRVRFLALKKKKKKELLFVDVSQLNIICADKLTREGTIRHFDKSTSQKQEYSAPCTVISVILLKVQS